MTCRRLLWIASAASLLLAGIVLPVLPAASADAAGLIKCGATIKTNTTLTSDLGPCPATAIKFGADNITLDLNGHTVFGTAAKHGKVPGIVGSHKVGDTVQNGTVKGFDTGVYFEFGSQETITRLDLHDNIGTASGNGIFGEGVQLFKTNNTAITDNVVTHNGTFAGIDLFDSSGNTVSRNTLTNNNVLESASNHCGVKGVQQDIGIWVVFLTIPTTGNIVSDNLVLGSGLDGIQISRFANSNTVSGNAVANNGFGQVLHACRDGDGIAIFGNSNLIQGNGSSSNGFNGIDVVLSLDKTGAPVGGQSNQILSNVAVGNGKGINSAGIAFDLVDTNLTPPCDSNLWSHNVAVTSNQSCVRN
ncbi:MAG: right-handed parallel beta-helix repeat-containing protein [Actinomycetota bacterium]|nr:right-handed parallel beta-helix repeat-containing protein [Actinomycetota bacterium]